MGSRVDKTKRGGDIDLYIETYSDPTDKPAGTETKFSVDLQKIIGEQKIDIVIKNMLSPKTLPIYKEARKTGVKLV